MTISGFTEFFLLNQSSYLEIWRFVSAIFLHGSLGHLLSNMVALALFGSILESLVGSKRFLAIFIITGVIANLVSVNLYRSSLGASGAIFGVLGVLIVLRPLMLVWAGGIPMPMFLAGIFWALIDLMNVFNPQSNIANFAHLSGMFIGLVIGFVFRSKMKYGKREEKLNLDEGLVRKWENYYMKRGV